MSVRRLRRAAASVYLKEKWGIDRKPSTLAKLACVGGGPRFVLFNRVPLYPESELDAWAESRLSGLKTSTSQEQAYSNSIDRSIKPRAPSFRAPRGVDRASAEREAQLGTNGEEAENGKEA